MSFQPPPSGGTPPAPPPPPPGQWGPPPGGKPAFDPKNINPLDWGILGVGALLFIFSFFDYYSLTAGPYSDSAGAWHFSSGSFLAWFAMAFGVVGAAVVALALFAPQVNLRWPSRLLGTALFAASAVFYILAIFIHPKFYDQGGVSFGHGFSFWLSFILALIGLVLSVMRLQQTGGTLPGALGKLPNIGQHGPQGGLAGGTAPHAGTTQATPPSYSPPPAYNPPPAAPPTTPPPGYNPPPPPPPPAPGYNPPPPPPPPGYGQPPQ